VTTDLDLSVAQVIEFYAARWKIDYRVKQRLLSVTS